MTTHHLNAYTHTDMLQDIHPTEGVPPEVIALALDCLWHKIATRLVNGQPVHLPRIGILYVRDGEPSERLNPSPDHPSITIQTRTIALRPDLHTRLRLITSLRAT